MILFPPGVALLAIVYGAPAYPDPATAIQAGPRPARAERLDPDRAQDFEGSLLVDSNGTDPTWVRTRVELRDEWQALRNRARANIATARVDVSPLANFVARVEVPSVWFDPDDASSDSGLGDVGALVGWNSFRDPNFAMFFGAGFKFDTASEDTLGQGKDQFVPTVSAAGALPEIHSKIYETFSHAVSYGGQSDRRTVITSKLDIDLMTDWPNAFWTQIGTSGVIDSVGSDKYGLSFIGEVGKMLNPNVGLWLRPTLGGMGSDSSLPNWSVEVGVRWML